MPKYRIKQYQTQLVVYEFETTSMANAVGMVLNDDDTLNGIPDSEEGMFPEIDLDHGMSCDEANGIDEYLVENLQELGHTIEWGIPSIHSIEKVGQA